MNGDPSFAFLNGFRDLASARELIELDAVDAER